MNKTLHQKLSGNNQYAPATHVLESGYDEVILGFRQETKMLRQAAKELLSPRSEAIARLLELSRSI
jgi:hypothetical protein